MRIVGNKDISYENALGDKIENDKFLDAIKPENPFIIKDKNKFQPMELGQDIIDALTELEEKSKNSNVSSDSLKKDVNFLIQTINNYDGLADVTDYTGLMEYAKKNGLLGQAFEEVPNKPSNKKEYDHDNDDIVINHTTDPEVITTLSFDSDDFKLKPDSSDESENHELEDEVDE